MLDSLKGLVSKLFSASLDLLFAQLVWWLLRQAGLEQKLFTLVMAKLSGHVQWSQWNFLWEKRFFLFYVLLLYILFHMLQILGVLLLGTSLGDFIAKDRYQNGTRVRLLGRTLLDFLFLPILLFHFPVLLGARTLPEWLMGLHKVRLSFFRLGMGGLLLPVSMVAFWMLYFLPTFLDYRFHDDGQLDLWRTQVKDINQKQDFSLFRFNQNIELGMENFSLLQGKRGDFLPALGLSRNGEKEKITAELWYWEKSVENSSGSNNKNQLLWRLSLAQKFMTREILEKIYGSGLILSARYPDLLKELSIVTDSPEEKVLQQLEATASDVLAAHWQYNPLALLSSLPQHLEAATFFNLLSKMIPSGTYNFTVSQRYFLLVEEKRRQAFVISWGLPLSNLYQVELGESPEATQRLVEFLETTRWKKITEDKGVAFKIWQGLSNPVTNPQLGEELYAYYHEFFKLHLSLDIESRLKLFGHLNNLNQLLPKISLPVEVQKSFEQALNAFKSGDRDFFQK